MLLLLRIVNAAAISCSLMWERRGAYMVLVGKPEGRRPLGRPRRRWEDNMKMMGI
jgi:hypothetical protein